MEIRRSIWSSPRLGANSPWRYFSTTATEVFRERKSLHFPEHLANVRQILFPRRIRRRMLLAFHHNRVLAFVRKKTIQELTDRRRV